MSAKERDLKAAGTFLHGTGTLYFKDEYGQLRELVGEIIVGKNSVYQDAYVKVVSKGKHYLMPFQSLESIKWDRKPQKQNKL
jgi:hypothetical protein